MFSKLCSFLRTRESLKCTTEEEYTHLFEDRKSNFFGFRTISHLPWRNRWPPGISIKLMAHHGVFAMTF
jgi:hypothetical protein